MKIGGDSGDSDGSKVLEPLVQALIAKSFLPSITWSGKTSKGKEMKIPLEKYTNILHLIYSLCRLSDESYLEDTCEHDMKYKIIKYAHTKYKQVKNSTVENDSHYFRIFLSISDAF